jgi:thioesterase domain-containing protein
MFAAVAAYRPDRYRGRVLLIIPEEIDRMRTDPVRIWKRHCTQLMHATVPGDHRTMIQGDRAGRVAAELSRHL